VSAKPNRRRGWNALSPNLRRLLVSHRPDPREQDEQIATSIRCALESVYGATMMPERVYDVVDDGEASEDELRWHPDGATLREVADELGLSVARTKDIQDRALIKLRAYFRCYGDEFQRRALR
jgi:DNA-directed RNA polymerase sigma subunit (sigma70/sigma32)